MRRPERDLSPSLRGCSGEPRGRLPGKSASTPLRARSDTSQMAPRPTFAEFRPSPHQDIRQMPNQRFKHFCRNGVRAFRGAEPWEHLCLCRVFPLPELITGGSPSPMASSPWASPPLSASANLPERGAPFCPPRCPPFPHTWTRNRFIRTPNPFHPTVSNRGKCSDL